MRVQLMLKAEKIPRPNGWFKKVNAFAIVSNVSDIGSVMGIKRHRIQGTEVIPSTVSPEWATIIIFDHQVGTDQRIAIDVFHTKEVKRREQKQGEHSLFYQGKVHRGAPIPSDSQQICGMLVQIQELLRSPTLGHAFKIPGTNDGKLHIKVESCRPDAPDLSASFKFQLRGYSFLNPRRSVLEKPDYYYEIHRKHFEDWALVHRSESIKGAPNPFWRVNFLDVEQFVNHDLSRDLRIRVFDLDSNGGRSLIGEVTTSTHGLLGAVSTGGNCDLSRAFQLTSTDGKKKVGQVVVVAAEMIASDNIVTTVVAQPLSELEIMTPPVTPTADSVLVMTTPTFAPPGDLFDEVMRYCDLELCLAIDFTKTNGDPRVAGTPHHRSNYQLNDYQWAVSCVADTVSVYSESKEYPVWGFGGLHNGQDQHIFLCGQSAKAKGVGGILKAYEATFQTEISFGNSRKLDTVIAAAAQHARKSLSSAQQHNRQSYTLLVVLTVGEDKDILAAKDKLVMASKAPLSILFLRIPGPRSSPFDPLKLEVYLGNRGCRDFCTCHDMKTLAESQDSRKLSGIVMKSLKQQIPKFFHVG